MPVEVQGPDGKTYHFPDGTDKAAAIGYFKKKGIGAKKAEVAPASKSSADLFDNFINHPLFPQMAETATGLGITEQNELYKALGPEAAGRSLANKVLHYGASLGAGTGRVFYGMLGMSPADVAVLTGSTLAVQPEIAGAWFGAKAAKATPGQLKAAFKNPTPENVEGALTTTAGLVGAAATAGSGKPSATLSKVGELRQSMKEGIQPFVRKITGVEPAVKEEVGRVAEKHGTALEKNKADTAATIKDNLRQQRETRTAIDQEKITAAEKNKSITAANEAQKTQVAKRGELAKTVDEQSAALGKSIEQVEAKVYKAADAKYDAVKEKIQPKGKPAPEAPADKLIASIKNIEAETLQGIPESIKEFRTILKMEGEAEGPLSIGGGGEISPGEPGYEQVKQAYVKEGLLKEGEPLTWDKLQSLKSRIEARLRKRGLINGDLKRGLFQADEAIVNEMGNMAEANGAGELWTDARGFWRRMREDFHEPTGPSGSGSPVAQALDAVDPKNIRQPFIRTQSGVGNRAIDILKKYPEYGGTEAAAQAEALLKSHETMSGLPKTATEKPLKTTPEAHQLPTDKPIPTKPETPTVDIRKVAREAIATRAKNWGMFNARDIGILSASAIGGVLEHAFSSGGYELPIAAVTYEGGKYAASRLLNKPAVIEWLSKTPKEEIDVINKIPGRDKIRIVDGITEVAVDQAKGGPVRLSPEARQLLGPANVAKIIAAAGGTTVGNVVKNRKEAIDLLRPATQ